MIKQYRHEANINAYFSDEKIKFTGLLKHSHLVGNSIGRRDSDSLRVIASWLFLRACVMGQSLLQLFDPPPPGFGASRYLDHASIAVICRALIETIAVLLYVGDTTISDDEWECRRSLIDLHDFVNRREFLDRISFETSAKSPEDTLKTLRDRVESNAFFNTLPPGRRRRLLDGDDMFINGRHAAMLELGWGEDLTRGIYKYLSNQAHSLSMAFHRTEANELYKTDSTGAKVVAAFATSFARRALGTGCLHMISLFPDTEMVVNPTILTALRTEYKAS
jgi:hypothetical protein